jgi:hypothetical protein
LLITDAAGHRVGYVNGALVDEIPGAEVEELIANQDWSDNLEPDFTVPANGRYSITIDGSGLTQSSSETLDVIGPSYDVAVKDIPLKPGERDTLVVDPDATKLSYTSSQPESPTLQVGVSDNAADYAFQIAGVSDQPGSTINLSLPAEGGSLSFQNVGSARSSTVDFNMTRSSPQGPQLFTHRGIPLAAGDTATVQFGGWTSPDQTLPLTTTRNGHSSSHSLSNQRSA